MRGGDAPPESVAKPRARGGIDALAIFVVIAAVAKILASAALVLAYRDWLQPSTFPDIVPVAHVAVFAGASVFLATAGSRDRRALHLGIFFLLVAVSFANGLVTRLADLPGGAHQIRQALLALHPDAFLPLYLWLFVTEFPRLRRFDRGEGVERVMVGAGIAAGAACFLATALWQAPAGPRFAVLSAIAWGAPGTWFDAVLFGLAFPALPFGLWKARRAEVRERRRYRLFVAGLAIGFLPMAAQVLAEAMVPAYGAFMDVPPRRLIVGSILYPLLLSIPVSTTYAVVVHRVLDVRLIVRKAVQYALARYTMVTLAAIPGGALVVALVRQRHEPLGALVTTPSAVPIVVPLAILLVAIAVRRPLLRAIDRSFFREALDTRRLLEELAATSVTGDDSLAAACRAFGRRLQSSLHVTQADILVADWEAGTLASPAGGVRSLPLDRPLATMLSERTDGLVVELEHPDPQVRDLPTDDLQWLADGGAHLLLPLRSGGEFIGVIVLGEKLNDLPFSREDQRLLAPVAASLALKVDNLRLRDISAAPPAALAPADDGPAVVCADCSFVAAGSEDRCGRCGGALAATQLPLLLAGKFKLERRLGRGGMGVVYLATDTSLERRVAIKTLPRVSVGESVRLRREARAMAAFAHPHLALIFGIESWRGAPALVMEYLEGGTLADRLRRGPLTPAETIVLAGELAGALELIHDAGLLHRDVKPSNIAFTLAGRAKLLDFGLAQMLVDEAPVRGPRVPALAASWAAGADLTTVERGGIAGTPAYMAPEARAGQALDGGTDLWSFGVVLFECLIGERPTAGLDDVEARRFLRTRVSDCPDVLCELVGDLLALDRRRRPRSARAVSVRLRESGILRVA